MQEDNERSLIMTRKCGATQTPAANNFNPLFVIQWDGFQVDPVRMRYV